jgi:hypothetical protein
MAKLPAFQFYPGDWQKDPELRRCSKAAKGVWIDMLVLMFECPNRGVFANAGGEPWSDQEIAEAIGGDTAANVALINELLLKGVAKRNDRGAIYSKRMVRDEQVRRQGNSRVKRHRNASCNGDVTGDVTPVAEDEGEEEVEVERFMSLPLNDNSEYAVTFQYLEELKSLYPAVDVEQQLRNMLGWLKASPDKRKTRRGVNKFINGWLAREQDRGPRTGSTHGTHRQNGIGEKQQALRDHNAKAIAELRRSVGITVADEEPLREASGHDGRPALAASVIEIPHRDGTQGSD